MKGKKESKFFTIMEHEKEELYLREKHKQGWKLVKAKGVGKYIFTYSSLCASPSGL